MTLFIIGIVALGAAGIFAEIKIRYYIKENIPEKMLAWQNFQIMVLFVIFILIILLALSVKDLTWNF